MLLNATMWYWIVIETVRPGCPCLGSVTMQMELLLCKSVSHEFPCKCSKHSSECLPPFPMLCHLPPFRNVSHISPPPTHIFCFYSSRPTIIGISFCWKPFFSIPELGELDFVLQVWSVLSHDILSSVYLAFFVSVQSYLPSAFFKLRALPTLVDCWPHKGGKKGHILYSSASPVPHRIIIHLSNTDQVHCPHCTDRKSSVQFGRKFE